MYLPIINRFILKHKESIVLCSLCVLRAIAANAQNNYYVVKDSQQYNKLKVVAEKNVMANKPLVFLNINNCKNCKFGIAHIPENTKRKVDFWTTQAAYTNISVISQTYNINNVHVANNEIQWMLNLAGISLKEDFVLLINPDFGLIYWETLNYNELAAQLENITKWQEYKVLSTITSPNTTAFNEFMALDSSTFLLSDFNADYYKANTKAGIYRYTPFPDEKALYEALRNKYYKTISPDTFDYSWMKKNYLTPITINKSAIENRKPAFSVSVTVPVSKGKDTVVMVDENFVIIADSVTCKITRINTASVNKFDKSAKAGHTSSIRYFSFDKGVVELGRYFMLEELEKKPNKEVPFIVNYKSENDEIKTQVKIKKSTLLKTFNNEGELGQIPFGRVGDFIFFEYAPIIYNIKKQKEEQCDFLTSLYTSNKKDMVKIRSVSFLNNQFIIFADCRYTLLKIILDKKFKLIGCEISYLYPYFNFSRLIDNKIFMGVKNEEISLLRLR